MLLLIATLVTGAVISAIALQTGTLGWLRMSWGVPSYGGW